jgi:Zn-dependent protease with chaperone function
MLRDRIREALVDMPSGTDERVACEAVQPGGNDSGNAPLLLTFLKNIAPRDERIIPPDDEACGEHVPGLTRLHMLRAAALAVPGYALICGALLALSLVLYRTAAFILSSPDPLAFLVISSPLLLVSLALLYGTLRAVWIRTPEPEGFEITPDDSPELFGTLDLIRLELKGPRIHRVLLTGDFKAFIVRTPRLGVFGWHRNHLVLGLPLLQALSPGEMLAVLAHEYGHLSGRQGRLPSWVYGVRKAWMQVLGKLEKRRGFKEILLARFFLWYAPYFQAHTTGLARAYEYGADQCSAAVAGKDQTAAALIRFEVLARYLHESFWPGVYALMDTLPEPVFSVYSLMQDKLATGPDRRSGDAWLEMSLSKQTGPEDSHPCLRERLERLDRAPALPSSPDRSAARFYFPRLDEVRGWLDREWRTVVEARWRERYGHVSNSRERLSELVARARTRPLSTVETLELAHLTEELSGWEEAFPFYQRILEYMPRFVPALCAVGRIWLAKGDESGVGYIEKAMDLDPSFSIRGLEALYNFYMGRGDREKTGKYYQKLYEQRESMERTRKTGRPRRLPARYMASRKKAVMQ